MKAPVGRVYVLSNKAMPGLLKIGYTMNTAEGRVKELSSATGVPSEFLIEYQVECRDAASVETLVHESLHNMRYNNSREFFSISLVDAVDLIRKHAKEIIDEEFYGYIEPNKISNRYTVTFYLVKVNSSKNLFRIGFIKNKQEFLETSEFKSMVIDLYNHIEPGLFCDCESIQSNEIIDVDDESLEKMREVLDDYIKKLKLLNKDLFDTENFYRTRDFDPRLNGKYDLRTLCFKAYQDSIPIKIYESSFSKIKPIAKECLDRNNTSRVENLANVENENSILEKTKRLDDIKRMGI